MSRKKHSFAPKITMIITRKATMERPTLHFLVHVSAAFLSVVAAAEEVNTNTFVVFSEVAAEDFPPIRTQTIFRGTNVYDTVEQPGSVIKKFDLDQQVVRIIDQKRKIQTFITFREIGEFQVSARARAAARGQEQRDRMAAFMARPNFATSFDPAARVIRLESPLLTYEAEVKQGAADVVDRFTDFADWTKQLSTLLDQACLAEPRMKLNRELRNKNFLPMRVTLRMPPNWSVSSRHRYTHSLDAKQEDFIQAVEKQLNTFPKTSFSEFLKTRKSAQVIAKK